MPKVNKNVTVEKIVVEEIEKLRMKPEENRSFSNMVEILLKEALVHRKSKKK